MVEVKHDPRMLRLQFKGVDLVPYEDTFINYDGVDNFLRGDTLTMIEERLILDSCIDRHPEGLVHYAIVRADLSFGTQAAQLLHASGESFALSKTPWEENIIGVALHVRDEAHLKEIAGKLTDAMIPFHGIVESDKPYTGQLMSIGLYPTRDRDAVRKVLSSLPLLR